MNLAFMPGSAVLLFYCSLERGSVDFCVLLVEYEMYHTDISLFWVSLRCISYNAQCDGLIYEKIIGRRTVNRLV